MLKILSEHLIKKINDLISKLKFDFFMAFLAVALLLSLTVRGGARRVPLGATISK